MIYFLQSPSGGPVKIGHSVNVPARVAKLVAYYGQPLSILATMEGGRSEERVIHGRFAHLRFGRTEQFRPDRELMEFIQRPLLVGATPDAAGAMPTSVRNVVVTGSPEWVEWLQAGAKFCRTDVSKMIDVALVEYAKTKGFNEPPPRR